MPAIVGGGFTFDGMMRTAWVPELGGHQVLKNRAFRLGIKVFALGLAVMLVLPALALAAPVLIDDTAFTYGPSVSDWTVYSDANMSGGSNHYSGAAGAWATVDFTGASVTYISTTGNNRGDLRIYLDGIDQGIVNQYSSGLLYQQRLWTKTGLSAGTHTLRVVRTGTGGGPYVEVDAIEVVPTPPVVSTPASSPWSILALLVVGMSVAVIGRRQLAQ